MVMRILSAIGLGAVEVSAMLVIGILARVGMVLVVVAGVYVGAQAAGLLASAFPFETVAPPPAERGAISGFVHGLLGGVRAHDPLAAHRDFVDEAKLLGGVVALIAMLVLPLLRGTLNIRGVLGTFALGGAMCGLLALIVALGAGFGPDNPWWPTVLSPLPAVLAGMALWRIVYWCLEALASITGVAPASPGGKGGGEFCDGSEPSLDFDFSFDISPG